MATTSLSLGEYWESFISSLLKNGRYGSASEVVRDALRHLEEEQNKINALRAYLAEGEIQALKGEFVEDYSIEKVIKDLDQD